MRHKQNEFYMLTNFEIMNPSIVDLLRELRDIDE
jgi:hypothetical protein